MKTMEIVTTQRTMSSRQIAEQTGKNHADVCRDVRKMLDGLELGESSFASSYLTAQNKQVTEYLLPQREAMILAGGYDVKVRAWFVDYFLESQKPKTQIELIIESAQALQAVDSRLTLLEHKVDTIDTNKEVLPKGGYASIGDLSNKAGFSKTVIKLFLSEVKPKSCTAIKQLPDGSVAPYDAYKIKPLMKFANKVRRTAIPVNKNEVYFTSRLLGGKRFQIK